MPFPAVDPLPLPAPVWLFKVLEFLTVSMHFLAMQLLVGGVLISSIWAIWGRWQKRDELIGASGAMATRLPVIMTYVINFGVPPLLFAQVLYGRAIYTSSILMGAFWISIIFLLMFAYSLLYVMSSRAQKAKHWGWIGLVSLVVFLIVGMIYTSNMTLMLRPDTWRESYRADQLGLHLNHSDPTFAPRWLFMMLSGITVTGVGMIWLSRNKRLTNDTAQTLCRAGTRSVITGAAVQTILGFFVLSSQPDYVNEGLNNWIYNGCLVAWIVLTVALIATSFRELAKDALTQKFAVLTMGLLFLQTLAMSIYRGGIRDAALAQFGFDVWDRTVTTNWAVVVGFLLFFALGLATVGWLTSVVAQIRPAEERYA